ncbi:MAG TPA: hypothetical protein QF446_11235 [Planctomycetota bacterium]|nr:hypothetical protein [Planctomycetota bacterium]
MKLTLEWMSQLRVAAGTALQVLDCPDGVQLTEALEQAIAALPDDRSEALRPLVLVDGRRVSALLVALDGVQVLTDGNPELRPGSTLVLSSPIAGG